VLILSEITSRRPMRNWHNAKL